MALAAVVVVALAKDSVGEEEAAVVVVAGVSLFVMVFLWDFGPNDMI